MGEVEHCGNAQRLQGDDGALECYCEHPVDSGVGVIGEFFATSACATARLQLARRRSVRPKTN